MPTPFIPRGNNGQGMAERAGVAQGFAVMAAGDMLGALAVLYALKAVPRLLPSPASRP